MEESSVKKSREIDVLGILKKLLHDWKTISLFVLCFAILGVISAVTRTKTYKTDVVLAPETNDSELSSLMDGFGNLIGGSFGKNSSDAIYPELYPNIFSSTTFLLDLFDVPVVLKDGSRKTYTEHIKFDYKPGMIANVKIAISKFIALFKEKEPVGTGGINSFHLTKEQYNFCKFMRKNIQCVVDQRTNLITVSVTDIDAVVAAIMADSVTTRLQKYIIDYRTRKTRHDLEYLVEMYNQAQQEYFEVQAKYAKFYDANMNVVRASQKALLENLNNEMQLKLDLYTSMGQQLQITRQRLQERTPAFMIIQPATVSLEAAGMSSMVRLLLFCFFGVLCGAVWCLYIRDFIKRKREQKSADGC